MTEVKRYDGSWMDSCVNGSFVEFEEWDILRETLIQADLKIRSFPGADQSDVEFIRKVLER